MRRSGMTSRSKWASFSRNQTSCSKAGPRGPALWRLLLSATGAPAEVVILLLMSHPEKIWGRRLLAANLFVQHFFRIAQADAVAAAIAFNHGARAVIGFLARPVALQFQNNLQ